jgi:hypothetical protein
MARLLFEKGVVRESADLNPVTGCWRVVYEKQGEGAKFKHLLDEEEGVPKSGGALKMLVVRPEYIVYAVTKERHLLLDFTRRVVHQNHINHFDLQHKIEYHVGDPKALIERMRAGKEDPLARLRDTVAEEVAGACKKVPWEVIKDERLFADVAEDLSSRDGEVFRRAQEIARYLGLAVSDLRLSLRLLEADLRDWKDDAEHRRSLAGRRRQVELKRADEDITDEEVKRELIRETWRGGVKALNTTVENIGRDTDTASKLRENLEALGSVFFPQMNRGAEQSNPSLPGAPPRLLAERADGPPGDGLSLLQQLTTLIFQLDLYEEERKYLLSAVLHLCGELLWPDEERPDALAHYKGRYGEALEQLAQQMSVRQMETLRMLLNVERL